MNQNQNFYICIISVYQFISISHPSEQYWSTPGKIHTRHGQGEGEVDDMKNEERACGNSRGQLKKKWEIFQGDPDKIMKNFHGFLVFGTSKWCHHITQSCGLFRDEALFSLESFQG